MNESLLWNLRKGKHLKRGLKCECVCRETVNALVETNELWMTRLEEATEEYSECLNQEMERFMQLKTKNEQGLLLHLC